jgi:hypothetical protein
LPDCQQMPICPNLRLQYNLLAYFISTFCKCCSLRWHTVNKHEQVVALRLSEALININSSVGGASGRVLRAVWACRVGVPRGRAA